MKNLTMTTASTVSVQTLIFTQTSTTVSYTNSQENQNYFKEIINNNDNNFENRKEPKLELITEHESDLDDIIERRPSSSSSSATTSINFFPESYKKRRKQLTPIRITSEKSINNLDLNSETFDLSKLLQNNNITTSNTINNERNLLSDSGEEIISIVHKNNSLQKNLNSNIDLNLDSNIQKCPLCEIEFDSSQNFQNHLNDCHLKSWLTNDIINSNNTENNKTTLIRYQSQLQSQTQMQQAGSNSSVRIFNLDAYCELCNKEFCNKYFLKTHKANKHKIFLEIIPSDKEFTPHFLQALSNELLDSNQSLSNIKKEDQFSSSENDNNEDIDELIDQRENQQEQFEKLDRTSPVSIQTPISYTIPVTVSGQMQTSVSILQQTQTPHTKKLTNSETFCEFCLKQYCNKYFLRVHKMRRHGKLVCDDVESIVENINEQKQTQTSPLNLIINENNHQNDNVVTLSETDQESFFCYMCHICNIKFSNLTLFELHKNHAHNLINSQENTSKDLQKLQSMIMQLNDTTEITNVLICQICQKDFNSKTSLQFHLLNDHEHLQKFSNIELILKDNIKIQKSSPQSCNVLTMCKFCDNEFKNIDDFRNHLNKCQNNQNNQNVQSVNQTNVISNNNSEKRLANTNNSTNSLNINNVTMSNYCEICNKELCNKYFMKTHMQRMHGIEIENGALIGGVICNICNKELCSKYFLRVHKHNTHGINDEPFLATTNTNLQVQYEQLSQIENTNSNTFHFDTNINNLPDINAKYNSNFNDVCPICHQRFRNNKWLTVHFMTEHAKSINSNDWEKNEFNQKLLQSSSTSSSPIMLSKNAVTSLKIPNAVITTTTTTTTTTTNYLQNKIFEENSNKKYNCSLCDFSTTIMSLMFAHEKSHQISSQITDIPGNDFNLSPKSITTSEKEEVTSITATTTATKTSNLAIKLKKRKFDETLTESLIMPNLETINMTTKLNELASSFQLPVNCAFPSNYSLPSDQYTMQKFIISELNSQQLDEESIQIQNPSNQNQNNIFNIPVSTEQCITNSFNNSISKLDKFFYPSIIFLPVHKKISKPINVQINLNPI